VRDEMGRDYVTAMKDERTFGVPRLRDQVAAMLGDAYSHNYIDTEDYEKRLELVESARSRGEIFSAIADFPASMKDRYLSDEDIPGKDTESGRYNGNTGTTESRSGGAGASSGYTERYESIFSSNTVSHSQLRENRVSCSAVFGEMTIDLSTLPPGGEFHIYGKIVFGEMKIYVPENTRIVRRCQAIFSDIQVKTAPAAADGPVVYIHGTMLFGSMRIREPRRKNKIEKVISAFFSD
jgi:hypothetical protein